MTQDLILYPVNMPIKIIGKTGSGFEAEVFKFARLHFPDFKEEQTQLKESTTGKYESLTIHVQVNSMEHLDSFYKDIQTCKDIVFTI